MGVLYAINARMEKKDENKDGIDFCGIEDSVFQDLKQKLKKLIFLIKVT
jgi:hypothetical protein